MAWRDVLFDVQSHLRIVRVAWLHSRAPKHIELRPQSHTRDKRRVTVQDRPVTRVVTATSGRVARAAGDSVCTKLH